MRRFKKLIMLLSAPLVLFGCENNYKEDSNNSSSCNIPNSVIQAFLNDGSRDLKIRQYDFQFACKNLQLVKDTVIENIRLRKYTLPSECGGCLDYNLMTIGEEEYFTSPINIESILLNSSQELNKDTIGNESKNKKVDSEILHQVSALNAYLSETANISNTRMAVNLGKNILTEFIFDYTLLDAVKEFEIDTIEYKLGQYLAKNSTKEYYWVNGVIFESDWSKSTVKEPINVLAINFTDYINVRY